MDFCKKLNELSKSSMILITSDPSFDGTCFMATALIDLLKRGHLCCLVTTHHELSHYSAIAARFGMQLEDLIGKHQLSHIDFLQTAFCDQNVTQQSVEPSSKSSRTEALFRGVYESVRDACAQLEAANAAGEKRTVVLIEDAVTFSLLPANLCELTCFIRYLRNLVESADRRSLLVHVSNDYSQQDDSKQLVFVRTLRKLAESSFDVRAFALLTNEKRLQNVDGELLLSCRSRRVGDDVSKETGRWTFKVTDRGIPLFTSGTAPIFQ